MESYLARNTPPHLPDPQMSPRLCDCFGGQTVIFQPTEADKAQPSTSTCTVSQPSSSAIQPIADIQERLIGKWCVMKYDEDLYPGIIQDVDAESSTLVKTKSRVGAN